jgi:dTDP-4-dehydrorhamnose reductase
VRILVTGANGLVGSRVASRLSLQGHEVFATGRGARRCEGGFAYQGCELTQPEALDALFAQARPELVLHCAAMTEVDVCEAQPEAAQAINVSATSQLASLARKASAHLVYVSTDYVFDGTAGPYDEDALPNPHGVYARTKHMGEQAVRASGGSWAIARTASVYGWPPAGRMNFGAWMVAALRAGQPVPVFEDQRVSPTLALNLAELLAELGTRRLPGVWHLAGDEVVSRVELGERVCQVFGFGRSLLQPVKMADVPLPVPRPARAGLLVEKAKRALTVQPLAVDASLRIFRDEFRAG